MPLKCSVRRDQDNNICFSCYTLQGNGSVVGTYGAVTLSGKTDQDILLEVLGRSFCAPGAENKAVHCMMHIITAILQHFWQAVAEPWRVYNALNSVVAPSVKQLLCCIRQSQKLVGPKVAGGGGEGEVMEDDTTTKQPLVVVALSTVSTCFSKLPSAYSAPLPLMHNAGHMPAL